MTSPARGTNVLAAKPITVVRNAFEKLASPMGASRALPRWGELGAGRGDQGSLREAWLRTELFGQRLAVTAGRLYERERAAIRAARDDFPKAWRRAAKPRLTAWLP